MTKSHNSTKGDNIALAPMLDFLNHTTEARVRASNGIPKLIEGVIKVLTLSFQ